MTWLLTSKIELICLLKLKYKNIRLSIVRLARPSGRGVTSFVPSTFKQHFCHVIRAMPPVREILVGPKVIYIIAILVTNTYFTSCPRILATHQSINDLSRPQLWLVLECINDILTLFEYNHRLPGNNLYKNTLLIQKCNLEKQLFSFCVVFSLVPLHLHYEYYTMYERE